MDKKLNTREGKTGALSDPILFKSKHMSFVDLIVPKYRRFKSTCQVQRHLGQGFHKYIKFIKSLFLNKDSDF